MGFRLLHICLRSNRCFEVITTQMLSLCLREALGPGANPDPRELRVYSGRQIFD